MYSDYHALVNLIHSYSEMLDVGDHAGLGRLFTHGQFRGVFEGPNGYVLEPPLKGSINIKQSYDSRVLHYEGNPRTRHVITNLIVDIADDAKSARARSYFNVIQEAPGLPLQVIVSGRYHDSFGKIDGKWWFTEKRCMPDYVGNASKHLTAPFDTAIGKTVKVSAAWLEE